jgi:hypothetical protein
MLYGPLPVRSDRLRPPRSVDQAGDGYVALRRLAPHGGRRLMCFGSELSGHRAAEYTPARCSWSRGGIARPHQQLFLGRRGASYGGSPTAEMPERWSPRSFAANLPRKYPGLGHPPGVHAWPTFWSRRSTATTLTAPPGSSKTRSASRATTSSNIASRRLGRPIASDAPVTSASGSRPRPAISRRDRSPPLPAALVRRGNGRLLHRARCRRQRPAQTGQIRSNSPWLRMIRSGRHESIFSAAALVFRRCKRSGSRIPKNSWPFG